MELPRIRFDGVERIWQSRLDSKAFRHVAEVLCSGNDGVPWANGHDGRTVVDVECSRDLLELFDGVEYAGRHVLHLVESPRGEAGNSAILPNLPQ